MFFVILSAEALLQLQCGKDIFTARLRENLNVVTAEKNIAVHSTERFF